MTTPIADRVGPLAHDIRNMIAEGLPGIATLNGQFAFIDATPHQANGDEIIITVRPVDFLGDSVQFVANLRIDAIARTDAQTAITAGGQVG